MDIKTRWPTQILVQRLAQRPLETHHSTFLCRFGLCMLTIRSLFGHVQVFFTLFANFAFAAPENVTVDDAALTGPVTITYLPSPSNWSQGNNCSGCIAKPDPSQAYNGTWHDTTYIPNSAVYQAFQFNFTGTFLDPVSLFLDLITLFTIGSGLYIFFILANTVTGARMSTSVNFILDGVPASSFTHNATTSTSYEYNQTVFPIALYLMVCTR